MLENLVRISKIYPVLGILIRLSFKILFTILSIEKRFGCLLRSHGIGGNKYKSLKKYHNLYQGKRCFIIATGPSLSISDLEKIKNEYTFGMNSIIKAYSQMDFRPTYYGIQDHIVYKELENEIKRYYKNSTHIFISNRIANHFKCDREWNVFPLDMIYHAYDRWFNEKYYARFSDDIFAQVYSGFSITYSLIEIAAYMGFSKIYLIGADCVFAKNGKNHFVEYSTKDKAINSAYERNIAGYVSAMEYSKKKGIRIVNVTRGGKLDIFEREIFEDVLCEYK